MSYLLARSAQASGDYVEQLTALTLALSQRERGLVMKAAGGLTITLNS